MGNSFSEQTRGERNERKRTLHANVLILGNCDSFRGLRGEIWGCMRKWEKDILTFFSTVKNKHFSGVRLKFLPNNFAHFFAYVCFLECWEAFARLRLSTFKKCFEESLFRLLMNELRMKVCQRTTWKKIPHFWIRTSKEKSSEFFVSWVSE